MTGNRELIEKKVKEDPGIGFKDLQRRTGLANGVLQHHLKNSSEVVRKKGALLPNNRCSECQLRNKCRKRCLLNVLKDEKAQEILRHKYEDRANKDIAEKLHVDDSTISYHVNKLRDLGLLNHQDDPTIEPSRF